MRWVFKNQQTRLNLISALILLVGLGAAALIYLTAENDSDSVLGYEIVHGHVYPMSPEDFKMYRHDLELYGGTFNVTAVDFTRWFLGLWHGKSLAITVACMTLLLAVGFIFVAHFLPSSRSDLRDESKRAGGP